MAIVHRFGPVRTVSQRGTHAPGVHSRQDPPPGLQRLAALQSGVLTREQVLGHGLSQNVVNRLVRSGSWQRISPGLYLTLPVAPSWDSLAWGGILLGGPAARLGPEASGYLHRLVARPADPIDVLVPMEKLVQTRGSWQFIRERPAARSGRSVGSPPRLSTEDTVLDLANQRSVGEVVGLVTKAVQSRLTTTSRLHEHLEHRARHRHRALLTDLLADVADGAESALELLYLRTVERAHGLPRGNRQSTHAGLPYYRDVRYDEFGVLVELDGRAGHEGVSRFRDMNRDNRHALLGG